MTQLIKTMTSGLAAAACAALLVTAAVGPVDLAAASPAATQARA